MVIVIMVMGMGLSMGHVGMILKFLTIYGHDGHGRGVSEGDGLYGFSSGRWTCWKPRTGARERSFCNFSCLQLWRSALRGQQTTHWAIQPGMCAGEHRLPCLEDPAEAKAERESYSLLFLLQREEEPALFSGLPYHVARRRRQVGCLSFEISAGPNHPGVVRCLQAAADGAWASAPDRPRSPHPAPWSLAPGGHPRCLRCELARETRVLGPAQGLPG